MDFTFSLLVGKGIDPGFKSLCASVPSVHPLWLNRVPLWAECSSKLNCSPCQGESRAPFDLPHFPFRACEDKESACSQAPPTKEDRLPLKSKSLTQNGTPGLPFPWFLHLQNAGQR